MEVVRPVGGMVRPRSRRVDVFYVMKSRAGPSGPTIPYYIYSLYEYSIWYNIINPGRVRVCAGIENLAVAGTECGPKCETPRQSWRFVFLEGGPASA